MEITYTLSQLPEIAAILISTSKHNPVWAFNASMGAGKTTLISELCRQLNVTDTTSSPTFSIINVYLTKEGESICHMDWYRLQDEEEAIRTGVEDALYDNKLTFVEWPDKAAGLLPSNTLFIDIDILDSDTRKITIKKVTA